MATDEETKQRWATITDPYEALREIASWQFVFGRDPYYADLHDALLKMIERIVHNR